MLTEEERKERVKAAKAKYEKKKSRQAQHNQYNRENYDRISLTLPKGMKDEIKAAGIDSVNGYIKELIRTDLDARKSENGNPV